MSTNTRYNERLNKNRNNRNDVRKRKVRELGKERNCSRPLKKTKG